MAQDAAHPSTTLHHGPPGVSPLPVLLVLEPFMSRPPWSSLVAQATATMQAHELAWNPVSIGTLATIEHAVRHQGVMALLACAEGPRSLVQHAALAARARKIARLVRSLGAGRSDLPRVGALWLHPEEACLRLFTVDPARTAFLESQAEDPLLAGLGRVLQPWTRNRDSA